MSPSELGAGVVDGRSFADELTTRERLVDAVSSLWNRDKRGLCMRAWLWFSRFFAHAHRATLVP